MKVVNCKKEKCTHYCGRIESIGSALGSPLDKSMLGNPFKVKPWGVYTREESIAKFRELLWQQWKEKHEESLLWSHIIRLPEDAILGCFCKPRACHCDVIVDAWKWVKSIQR